jgi:hypothetical protein
MRLCFRSSTASLATAILVAALAGCSTGSQQPLQTSSLSPRPDQGMVRPTPRYADARPVYSDPGHPTPREFAAASDQYGLAADRGIQTASIGQSRPDPYGADGRWRQPGITTGSTGYGANRAPYVVEVREGDTLYGLSRRYNVPVGDLVAANRLQSQHIVIGQHLVIPTRYR